ncbi:ABC transporter permease [Actinoallomurus liliacearum]|uniref:Transport permease protein n=1 Tax=Actinoallomurus liliacearum TaxID=1080073 RepID=A0ABP8TYC6_9ACTN
MTALATTRQAGSHLPMSTLLVAKRALLTFMRTPQLVVLSTVQMAGFLVAFRYVFGGAIGTSQGLPYVDFAVPGFIAAGVLFSTLGTAIAMADDLQSGLIDRLRSLPMPRSSVLIGRVLADVIVLTWSLGVTTAVGFAIGFRLHGTVAQGIAAFGVCLLFGLAFSWVFIAAGLLAGNAQAANGVSLIVFVLTFVSNAYVPSSSMPSWIRGFADNQPVTLMADTVRALTVGDRAQALLGHDASYFMIRSLIWTAALMVGFGALAVAIYRRR